MRFGSGYVPDLPSGKPGPGRRAYVDEGSVMVPADTMFREERTGAALAALPAAERAAAEERGAALDLEAAVRLALAETG